MRCCTRRPSPLRWNSAVVPRFKLMRITWVNPSFADYRVPVYSALNETSGGGLTVVFSRARTSPSVCAKIDAAMGEHAVGLDGERSLSLGFDSGNFANNGLQVPYQPGLLRAIGQNKP